MAGNGKGNSVFLNNGGGGLPCLTNAVFLTKSVSETGIVNKLSGGDANFKGSNGIKFQSAKSNGVLIEDSIILSKPYIVKLKTMSTGVFRTVYQSSVDLTSTLSSIITLSYSGVASDFASLFVGSFDPTYDNETLSFLHRSSNIYQIEMYLRLGANFLNDGNAHIIELIIDGIDNRFVVDGVTYNEASGHLTFKTGSATTEKFFNVASAHYLSLGYRKVSGVFSTRLDAILAGVEIEDVFNFPLSENGGFIDSIENLKFTMLGDSTEMSATQDGLHLNQNNGFSNYILANDQAFTDLTHEDSDIIEFECDVINYEAVSFVELFTTAIAVGNKGIKIIQYNEDITLRYYNGVTSEDFLIENTALLKKMTHFYLRYASGFFTIISDSTEYNFAVTIALFTGESTYSAILNRGIKANMFNMSLKKNSVNYRTYYVLAKDDLFDINDMRLTNPAGLSSGTDYYIAACGGGNIVGIGSFFVSAAKDIYYRQSPYIQVWQDGNWSPMSLSNSYSYSLEYKDRFGIEYNMCTQLEKLNNRVLFYKYARYTETIVDWKESYWEAFLYHLNASGKTPNVLLWDCCQIDTQQLSNASKVYEYCNDFFTEFKILYPNAAIIVSLLSNTAVIDSTNRDIVNQAYTALYTEGKIDKLFSTDALTLEGTVYFNYAGLDNLSGLYYDKIMEIEA